MTERDEMLALAERLEKFQRVLESARQCDNKAISVWSDDPLIIEQAVAALRSAARTDADAGYGAGFEACIAKVLELKSRWDRAANNDELRSDANRHRHYATAAKLIQQELDAIAALPAPGGITTGWQPIETAPHNTRVILAWRDWRDDAWLMEVGPATTGQRFENGYSNLSKHGSATHWQPLPPAPTITRKERA